ncbi:EFR1 family ferrodoxin [Saccharicrinis fermentans]|nr:EFR1 family ferrodoxin [Saccharicrinis fermentans]
MESISLVYYSPTRTTQKICREVAKGLDVPIIDEINIAEDINGSNIQIEKNCLTLIGLPVYGGRLPINTIESLKKLKSDHSPAIIVVVYGNRDYDDALLELKEIIEECGFVIVAGAAFIGEHSYSTHERPIAMNRPDNQDLEKCKDFAVKVNEKLMKGPDILSLPEPSIPGNHPYKERKQLSATVYPKTDQALCTLCGTCVDVCPVGAISIEQSVVTNGELCTVCCACVKQCSEQARRLEDTTIDTIREKLFLNCSSRKEPSYFL